MNKYPAITLFGRYGKILSFAIGLFLPATALWTTSQFGFGWPLVGFGLIAGLVSGFLTLVLTELTQLLTEMLMPR